MTKKTKTTEAELRQLRASLRVARAAAAEEKKRRVSLEEHFDANVSEKVAKAIAAAASRLLDKMPEEEEEEEEGGRDQERGGGDVEREVLRREGDARLSNAKEHDHGDGDANRSLLEHCLRRPGVVRERTRPKEMGRRRR